VNDGSYQTLGFPLKFAVGKDGILSFEQLDLPAI
jgi:hypothetical protein